MWPNYSSFFFFTLAMPQRQTREGKRRISIRILILISKFNYKYQNSQLQHNAWRQSIKHCFPWNLWLVERRAWTWQTCNKQSCNSHETAFRFVLCHSTRKSYFDEDWPMANTDQTQYWPLYKKLQLSTFYFWKGISLSSQFKGEIP